MYNLVMFGMVLVLPGMIRVPPYQNSYFAWLVDRTTPEYLRSQYEMPYWDTAYREGLEYLLQRYPTGPIAVTNENGRAIQFNRKILPRADRDRIVLAREGYDFFLIDTNAYPNVPLRPNIQAIKVYNNTILTVHKMMLTAEDADTTAYLVAHQATVDTEPIIRAALDIYLQDDTLIYAVGSCAAVEGSVFLHLHPAQVEDLPRHRVEYGFDNHDFYWKGSEGGDGRCLRIVLLPKYEIVSLATGQFNEGGPLWRETFVFPKRATDRDADVANGTAQGTVESETPKL